MYFKRRWVWQTMMQSSLLMFGIRSLFCSPFMQHTIVFLESISQEQLQATEKAYNVNTTSTRIYQRFGMVSLLAIDLNTENGVSANARNITSEVIVFMCSYLMWRTILSRDFAFVVRTAIRKAFQARMKGNYKRILLKQFTNIHLPFSLILYLPNTIFILCRFQSSKASDERTGFEAT